MLASFARNIRHDAKTSSYYAQIGAIASFVCALPVFVIDYWVAENLGYSPELTREVILQHFFLFTPLLGLAIVLSFSLPSSLLHIYYFVELLAFSASGIVLALLGAGELIVYFLPTFALITLSGVAMIYVYPKQSLIYLMLFLMTMFGVRYGWLNGVEGIGPAWTSFLILFSVILIFSVLLRKLFLEVDSLLSTQEDQIDELTRINALLDISLNENQFGLAGYDQDGKLVFERGLSLKRIFARDKSERQHGFDFRKFNDLKTCVETLTGEEFDEIDTNFSEINLENSHYIISAYSLQNLTIVSHMDVTKIRQIEEELRSHQKFSLIGEITSGVAHNYNNALAVALSNMEALPIQKQDPLWQDYVLPSIAAIEQSAEISKKLLTLAGRQRLEIERFDLGGVLNSMRPLLQSAIGAEIELEMSYQSSLFVQTDRYELESAILNLAINSRNAVMGRQDAKISVEAYQKSSYAVVRVKDNGHGIAPNILGKIFDPFFSTHSHKDSSGLGLATVKGFVEQSRGFVEVESRPGATELRLFFPLYKGEIKPVSVDLSVPDEPQVPIAHQSILFVDDNTELLGSLSRLLSQYGIDAVYEHDPKAALEIFESNSGIKKVILDLSMPGFCGIELGHKMMKIRPKVEVYLLTGEISNRQIRTAKELGFADIYIKPIRAKQLAGLLGGPIRPDEIENFSIYSD